MDSSPNPRAFRLLLAAFLVAGPAACGDAQESEALGTPRRGELIYGTDDRREGFEEPLGELARRVMLAVISPATLDFTGEPVLGLRAAPLSAWDDYCAGERFLEQPTAARCGAVLIDRDLVLTASHCVERDVACRDQSFVLDYAYDEAATLAPLSRESVFGCRQIAASARSALDSEERLDLAIVQLDRGVPAREPLVLRPRAALDAAASLALLGFPLGLPLKVDASAVAGDPRAELLDGFTLAADTYRGSSGSAAVDGAGQLAGILVRGSDDFVDRGPCRQSRVLGSEARGEFADYAFRAVDALCEAGWPSQALCGIAASCGDGVCSPEEHGACAVDCPQAECGDALCERSEWSSCLADCGDRRPDDLPNGWYCEAEWFADGATCDCDCGSFDPDCGDPSRPDACDAKGPAGREVSQGPALAPSGGCSISRRAGGGARREIGLSALILLLLRGSARALRIRRRRCRRGYPTKHRAADRPRRRSGADRAERPSRASR